MYFDLRGFTRFIGRALFPKRDAPTPLTPRRLALLAGFFPLYAIVETAARLGFLVDDLVFRGYRRQPIDAPVFITGNPRSGTTYLQRLLAHDTATFTGMKLWEILFAPSVAQRRAVMAVARLDRRGGRRTRRTIARHQHRILGRNRMHHAGLFSREEDQYYLVHIWSTLAVWEFAGMLDEARRYINFEADIPKSDQDRIMAFHRLGIQRHLYARRDRPGRHYLSKNPSASAKIDALYRTFPDARIIYLVRNPLDMIPSMVSTLDYTIRLLADPPASFSSRDFVLEMARQWYTAPLARLDREPPERYILIRYDDLVADAGGTARRIYEHFGLAMHSRYGAYLDEETERERAYTSAHAYNLAALGLDGDRIVADFRDVFDRFGFDTRGFGA